MNTINTTCLYQTLKDRATAALKHGDAIEKNLLRAGLSNNFMRFRDGQEVLDHFAQTNACTNGSPEEPSCLVLLDINMPRVNGIDATRSLSGVVRWRCEDRPLRRSRSVVPRRIARERSAQSRLFGIISLAESRSRRGGRRWKSSKAPASRQGPNRGFQPRPPSVPGVASS